MWPAAESSLQILEEAVSADLQVEIIDDITRFNEIAREWDELVDRSGLERLFLSHAWIRTWWEAFAGGRQLHIVTVRMAGVLVGAAPMMRSRARVYGVGIDSVESIYNPHTLVATSSSLMVWAISYIRRYGIISRI